MSALPFVIQLITKIIFAGMADYWVSKKILSHNSIVKFFNLLGLKLNFILNFIFLKPVLVPEFVLYFFHFVIVLSHI